MHIKLVPFLALLLACAPKAPEVQSPVYPLAALAPAEPLPFDPDVRQGVLDNGIRYYIETNDKPDDRAVFRLVVEAGSILEDPDQLGLAHFVEHMAFNGTTHFEGNELVRYLEKTGTRFGAHLNAHTSFDETVYKLQVPTDDAEVFGQAFQILEDWAHGMKFDPEEVERERGVVLEEWRRSLGPWDRARKVTMPVSYAGSPYPERLPIGTEESLKTFTREAAVRFYEAWYRPDLMSVIVIGDVDPVAVEAKIREHFAGIEAPAEPRERLNPDIPDRNEAAWTVFADPELTRTFVTVEAGHDWVLKPTYREYREGFVQQAFFRILGERYTDLARDPAAPLLGAQAWRGRRSPTEGAWGLRIDPQEGKTVEAYELALVELERMRRHEVTEAELTRAKAAMLRSMESYYNERETTESAHHAEELIRHVTTGESVPGVALEWELAQKYIPTLTAAEIQAFGRDEFLPAERRTVAVMMPQKEGLAVPTADALKAVEAKVAALEIAPPVAEEAGAPLVSELPAPGSITAVRAEEALGFEVWTLSNGAEVWVKPTDFEAEQVLFRARSIGGNNAVPEPDYVAATSATDLVSRSGLGALKAPDLEKRLTGHKASVRPWVGGTHEGLSGSAAPEDLELLMQLAYLTFTAPRFDEEGLQLSRRSYAEQLRNRLSDPRTSYNDARTKLIWQDFPRYRPWTEQTLEGMDLARSQAFFTDRFADASDFRFTFVGNIDPEALKPLVSQYLASLPAVERPKADAYVDHGARRVLGKHEATIRSGAEPQADVAILLHGSFDSTFVNRNRLEGLQEVLSTRLREVLREDKGGVYGVSVRAGSDNFPEEVYTVEISFVCDPERVPELEQATFEVIEELKKAPVDPRYVVSYQQKSLRSRQESLRSNTFWAGIADATVDELALTGESLADLMNYDERVMSLTPEVLHAFAKDVLGTKNVVVTRRLPGK